MANKKQEKRVLIRQPTLPLFSVPCFVCLLHHILGNENCFEITTFKLNAKPYKLR